jgi:hypothetical protein
MRPAAPALVAQVRLAYRARSAHVSYSASRLPHLLDASAAADMLAWEHLHCCCNFVEERGDSSLNA